MDIFSQLPSVRRLMKKQNSKHFIIIALLCFFALWWQATTWYDTYLVEQERVEISHQLSQHASELSQVIHSRFALLQGLASFVETDIVPQAKITPAAKKRLDTFLSGLFITGSGIRNFAVAPNGVIEYISPLNGNKEAFGYDLLNDPSPSGGIVSRRAIEQRSMALTAPITLRQGGVGLIGRQAIYHKQETWGIVSMVLDVKSLLRDAGTLDASALGHIALRDLRGNTFFGSEQVFTRHTISQRIKLPEGYWELGVDPLFKKEQSSKQLNVFKISLAAFFLLVTGLFFAFQPRNSNFIKQPAFQGEVVQSEITKDGGPPAWLPPALTAAGIICAIIAFYFFMQRNDLSTQQQKLDNAMVTLTNTLQRRLKSHITFLNLTSAQIAFQHLSTPAFQSLSSRYITDHSGLAKIIWVSREFTILAMAPYKHNESLIGAVLSHSEAKRISEQISQLKQVVYSNKYVNERGESVFEVYVPIINENQLMGTLVGVYRIDTLLDGLVSESLHSAYKVELLNSQGKVLYTDNQEGKTLLTQTTVVSPLQSDILLRLGSYEKNSSQSMVLLLLLSMLLAMGVTISLWLQYRQSCKYWQTGKSLHASQQHFRAIAHGAPMAIVISRPRDGIILYANAQAQTLFQPDLSSSNYDRAIGYCVNRKDYRNMQREMIRNGYLENIELELKKGDQTIFWGGVSAKRVSYGQDTAIIISVNDLTERKKYEDQLFNQANFDLLTGLPNRGLAFERLERALIKARREGGYLALMMLDLDHFKQINDNFGHDAGDYLLKEITKRMTGCIRAGDTVARIGGDEFSLLLPELGDAMEAELIAEKIIAACAAPVLFCQYEMAVGVSIGIAIYPDDGENHTVLFKHADIAMYKCKNEGRNSFRFYTDRMNDQALLQLKIEQELRQVLARKELYLEYQPLINVTTNNVAGVEALLRWVNPTLGQVSPQDFIPIAERIGLINEIGQWVLETACAQIKQWQNKPGMPLYVAVNVSARQLRDADLVQIVADVLAKFNLEPAALELEITESVLLGNTEKNSKTLKQLHQMGLSLAIDHFGIGYSSLKYIRRSQFDTLKIDSSFVESVPDELAATQLVNAMISMANNLGLNVVVEGVENKQQLDFVSHSQLVQGFYLAKPMSAEKIEAFVKANLASDTDQ
ncbi:MAG: EAL domain-containing protein [Gammaproteobacteria bacterium]|nr:EAL domain-containing protein [Gammaproteobacteria bacterium]